MTAIVSAVDAQGRAVGRGFAPLTPLSARASVSIRGHDRAGERGRALPGQLSRSDWCSDSTRGSPRADEPRLVTDLRRICFMRAPSSLIIAALMAATAAAGAQSQEGFRFRSGVDLVNVTATVTDDDGRFVSGLRRGGLHRLRRREAARRVALQQRSGARQPRHSARHERQHDRREDGGGTIRDRSVHLRTARQGRRALPRGVRHRRAPHTGLDHRSPFDQPRGARGVSSRRDGDLRRRRRRRIPTAQAGTHRKKALLVISDGNDTNSATSVGELRQQIRESEVLVYALGIDGSGRRSGNRVVRPPVQVPFPMPFPFPGGRRPGSGRPPIGGGGGGGASLPSAPGDRVNADALRQITDDTGGRTEIVRGSEGLGRPRPASPTS